MNRESEWQLRQCSAAVALSCLPCISVLWKVFDPPCFSLTFFPSFLFSLLLPRGCFLWALTASTSPANCLVHYWLTSLLSHRRMGLICLSTLWIWRPAHVRAAFGSSAHLRSDSWSVRRSCATPLAIHTALAAGPWSGLAGLERAWASQAFYVITSLLVSLGLHLL